MSLFSRLFGKPSPEAEPPVDSERDARVVSPPLPDPSVRAHEEEASLSQAIAAGDMATIGKWVLEGSSTRIRQRAARSITDPDQLRELIPATRHGKDKNVHRILTTRRDELLAEVRSTQQLQADLDRVCCGHRPAQRTPVRCVVPDDPRTARGPLVHARAPGEAGPSRRSDPAPAACARSRRTTPPGAGGGNRATAVRHGCRCRGAASAGTRSAGSSSRGRRASAKTGCRTPGLARGRTGATGRRRSQDTRNPGAAATGSGGARSRRDGTRCPAARLD